MPQLDVAFFPSQLLWLFIAFLALYLYIKCGALPKIESVILRRTSAIAADLKLAQELERQAVLLQEQCIDESLKTNAQIADIHHQAMLRFSLNKQERLDNVNQRFLEAQQKQMSDIFAAQKIADQEMPNAVVMYAGFVINKITGIQTKVEDLAQCYQELRGKV